MPVYPGARPFAPLPLQELHHYYEPVRRRVGIGTQRLTVSAARRAPSRHRRPSQATDSSISTRLPTFPVVAADQARAVFTPDTIWPVDGFPPDSSRRSPHTSVLMSSLLFRCFVNGLLSLAFLIPA